MTPRRIERKQKGGYSDGGKPELSGSVKWLDLNIQLVEQAYDAFRENCPEVTVCNLLAPKDKANKKGARIVFSRFNFEYLIYKPWQGL